MYLSRVLKIPPSKRVYIMGESGIETELTSEGITYFSPSPDSMVNGLSDEFVNSIGPDPSVAAVVVRLDCRYAYWKIALAFGYLQSPDCHFFATNLDSTFPMHGKLLPGTGTMVAPNWPSTGSQVPVPNWMCSWTRPRRPSANGFSTVRPSGTVTPARPAKDQGPAVRSEAVYPDSHPPLLRELDGVAGEVQEDLAQRPAVGPDGQVGRRHGRLE